MASSMTPNPSEQCVCAQCPYLRRLAAQLPGHGSEPQPQQQPQQQQPTVASAESLAADSQRLLALIQGTSRDRVAEVMAADPAILECGRPAGSTLDDASQRLLTLVQNIAEHPGTSVATDPAVVRIGPAWPIVRGGTFAAGSGGGRTTSAEGSRSG
ncbi:hypothetical protein SLS62_006774 [Diatrype stigma]|uniref:Uncharacterized protein n=1 Tax=Diatrype stigma TaxID=117547 RepID=A0AAN9UXT9_9PEZI